MQLLILNFRPVFTNEQLASVRVDVRVFPEFPLLVSFSIVSPFGSLLPLSVSALAY